MAFYGKLEFPGPGHFAGPSVYYRESFGMNDKRRLWETVGRPVIARKLARDAYFDELSAGMGREWHAVPTCPPTNGEVAMEAQRILYHLHECYERSRWLADLSDFYVIAVSDSFAARTWRLWRRNFPIKGYESRRSPVSAISVSPTGKRKPWRASV